MTAMQFLTVVGLLTSLVIIVGRGWGMIWPAKFRDLGLKIADEKQWVHTATAAFLLVLAGLIFISLALTLHPLQTILAILFGLFTTAGVLMLRFPEAYRKLVTELLKKLPDFSLRIVCGVAVLFGLWMIWLVFTAKNMGG